MLTEKLKLDTDEYIIRTVRKHWFILLSRTFGLLVAGIFPIAFLFWLPGTDFLDTFAISIEDLEGPIRFLSYSWLIIIWMALFGVWTDYYLDMWTITNRRVIAIDQQGFFHRSVASFRLERLQDLNIKINGIIATLLDFGTIEAETASHDDSFVIHGAPHPREIKSLIQKNADQLIPHQSEGSQSSSDHSSSAGL